MTVQERKNSVYNAKNGRYVLGGITEVSSWSLEYWTKNKLISDPTDLVYFVEKVYESQPRKLGMLFYGDEELWWMICQYNGILDPIEELVEGRKLIIPILERIKRESLVQQRGGVSSLREDV